MSTQPQRTCPTCGNELSGAVEFCPVCMLRKGLAGGVESGESALLSSHDSFAASSAARLLPALRRCQAYEGSVL
jgi:hypothetical protein